MGADTPRSFFLPDVASWLRLKGMGGASDEYGLGEGGLGSVSIGRLRWGKQGPIARRLVQDGFLPVRVDRHDSHVGNPFAGAPVHKLCQAYDDLLRAVLAAPLLVDDGLHDYEGLRQDTMFGQALLTSFEITLLQNISEKHGVKVHPQRVRPLAVRSWLAYHSLLLVQGTSLTLLCWCTHGGVSLPPGQCHAQLLMRTLLWTAVTKRHELISACRCLPTDDAPLQDTSGVLAEVSLHLCLSIAQAFLPSRGWPFLPLALPLDGSLTSRPSFVQA